MDPPGSATDPPTAARAPERVRTSRLVLARMAAEDLPLLEALHRDPRVMATLGGVRSLEQTRAFLAAQLAHWDAHGFGTWTARDAVSGDFVGRGALRHIHVGGRDEVEVAYALRAEWWRRGLATEIARACVRVAFEDLRLPDLVAFTLPTNHGSRGVMRNAGFVLEREVLHAGLAHVLYRLRAPGGV